MDALIRRAAPEDAGPIANVECEREGGRPEQLAPGIRRYLVRGAYPVWVAEVGDSVLGFAKVGWVDEATQQARGPTRNVATGYYLMGVTVAAAHRRRGLGRALTQARLQWLGSRGVREVFFLANPTNKASIALHRPFGFAEVTRDIAYPGIPQRGRERALYRAPLEVHG